MDSQKITSYLRQKCAFNKDKEIGARATMGDKIPQNTESPTGIVEARFEGGHSMRGSIQFSAVGAASSFKNPGGPTYYAN